MTEKKKWQNPELIVLVRGRPEEAVLTACKEINTAVTSPNAADGNCFGVDTPTACNACDAPVLS